MALNSNIPDETILLTIIMFNLYLCGAPTMWGISLRWLVPIEALSEALFVGRVAELRSQRKIRRRQYSMAHQLNRGSAVNCRCSLINYIMPFLALDGILA